jgi:hypothetical protein
MKGIFISYRREDSAGHAGRLFDGLKEHFGAARVFMDVSDLRPGQDFVVELQRALAHSDCLLAVIGPRWLDAGPTSARRRIDDPGDFVRREIVAGLEKGATVIPVLVHGATLPPADLMPEALRPLARRQAVTLTDQRWDSDLRELLRFLATDDAGDTPQPMTGASAKPSTRSRGIGIGAIALAALAMAAGAAWMAFNPAKGTVKTSDSMPPPASPTAIAEASRSAVAGLVGPARTTASPQRFAVAIPQVSEVRFRTNRAQIVFTILAIRQAPRDGDTQLLSLLVRMLNRGPADESFGSDQFRLIAGDRAIAPEAFLNSSTDAMEAKDTTLRFVAPAGLVDAVLEVRVYAESTRMPIALSARSPIADDPSLDDFGQVKRARVVDAIKSLPALLPAGQRVELGAAAFQILEAVIERETVENASLTLSVRCSVPRGSGGVNFWSKSVRLWIDGVPRAPVNFVNQAVGPGDSKDARFVFDLPTMPQSLEVGIYSSGDGVRVPLALSSLPVR